MTFKRRDKDGAYIATGIRGEWQIHPWEAKYGETLALLLYRDMSKPRPFGFYFNRDDAAAAAERYDERGN